METNIVLDIKEFNPKEAELTTLAQSCSTIDTSDLAVVKAKRLELKNARVEITKYGKALREGATKFAKDVIAREKELVAIIEPEEAKLQAIEAEVKLAKEREERKALLPQRIERLKAIWGEGHNYGVTEEQLLDMDGATFEALVNANVTKKNEADRAEIARQQAEIAAQKEEQRKEQERLDWEAKSAERAELARKEERERMAQEQADKEAREKADAEEKEKTKFKGRCDEVYALGLKYIAEQNAYILEDFYVPVLDIQTLEDGAWALLVEKIKLEMKNREDARIEAERVAKLEADQRYQQWLIDIDYEGLGLTLDESTEGYVVAYQVVSTFKK